MKDNSKKQMIIIIIVIIIVIVIKLPCVFGFMLENWLESIVTFLLVCLIFLKLIFIFRINFRRNNFFLFFY